MYNSENRTGNKTISTAGNTGFTSGGVMCKLGTLCFYSSVVLVDSLVLRNPPELKARKRFTTLPAGAQKTLRGPIKNGISDAASAAPHLLSQYYTGRFKHLSSKFYFQLKFF